MAAVGRVKVAEAREEVARAEAEALVAAVPEMAREMAGKEAGVAKEG